MRHLSAACAIAGLCVSSLAIANDDPRVDNEGRDMGNYPPPRHFDHLHMLLEIDIPDMGKPMLNGIETLTVTPIGRERAALELDAGPLNIQSISIAGRPQKYTLKDGLLSIELSPPLPLGKKADVRIAYSVEYPKADGTGLTWTAGRDTATSLTDKAAQIHSQGQPDYNHTWFPCQDFPNERLTTELVVTVEDPYIVTSNGHLVDSRYAGIRDGKKRTTWHWLQDKPHCTYLVCMNVGRFAVVGLPVTGDVPTRADGQRVECYLYAPLGTEAKAQRAYAKTPAMVAHFNSLFGEPYAWDKYSQALVRRFRAGGMENTSATTMQSSSATAGPGTQDEVISHELAHQWFGDLMTCKGWEHAWLNEGWASFAEALWAEHDAKGRDRNARQAYQRVMVGFLSTQRAMNRTSAPDAPPLVSNLYGDAMEPFMKANDIYSKGACVLHMLRQRLGDDIFWRGVHAYIQKHKYTCVETDDFRHALEEASGLSLERFFNQWCYRPGLPRLSVELEWKDTDGGSLHVSIDQTQRIDAANPAYAFTLPILLKSGDSSEFRYIDIDTKHADADFKLPAKPSDVVVDPNFTFAAATRVAKPLAMWLRQLDDESLFAQVLAADELGTRDEPEAVMALARIAADAGRDNVVRRAAGVQLAGHYRRVLESLIQAPPPASNSRRPALAAAEVSR
jgi:aminopeptidase N